MCLGKILLKYSLPEGQQAFVQSVVHDESSDGCAVITTWGALIEIPSGSTDEKKQELKQENILPRGPFLSPDSFIVTVTSIFTRVAKSENVSR